MTRLIGSAFLVAVALFVFWLLAGPVKSQVGSCMLLDLLDFTAAKDFGEYRWGWGVMGRSKVKFYRNPVTGSFTVAVLPHPGVACLLVSGQGFVEDIEEPPFGGKRL